MPEKYPHIVSKEDAVTGQRLYWMHHSLPRSGGWWATEAEMQEIFGVFQQQMTQLLFETITEIRTTPALPDQGDSDE